MKKILLITFICLSASLSAQTEYAQPSMYLELNQSSITSMRNLDDNLPFSMRIDKWFPYHSMIRMENSYYLTTQYFNGFRGDFNIKYDPYNPHTFIVPDTDCTFTENSIIFKNGEVVPAVNLTEQDFHDIAPQLAWLQVLFRSLGTPVPDLILGYNDEVENWVVIYEDGYKNLIMFPTFADAMRHISQFYQGYVPYFSFKDIHKSNGRLEFFATLLVRDRRNEVTDYVDVRFHTDIENVIDLVMFFIYRKTDIKPDDAE